MKAHSAILLSGGITGLSAASAAVMKNGAYEPMDMDLLEFEEVEAGGTEEARGDMPSTPVTLVRYKGAELVKFQKALERRNSSSPWDVCSWGEFKGVGLGEDEKLSSADNLREVGSDYRFDAFLGFPDTGKPKGIKSCLLVNVDKREFIVGDEVSGKVSKKWAGNFSWFWSIMNGNRAFVSLNMAETNKDRDLQLKGIFYLLERESSINDANWRIRYYKEVKESDNKVISFDDFDRYFPKPNAVSEWNSFGKQVNKNWDFMTKSDFSNIFTGKEKYVHGVSGKGALSKYEWTVGEECQSFFRWQCDRVDAWTQDTSDNGSRHHLDWFHYMYGNAREDFNLGKNLQPFSIDNLGIGIWRKK